MTIECFETTNDFELCPNKEGHRTCTYEIHNANSGNGLVVYIPGFGGDLGGYTERFCKAITKSHPQYAALCVDYFCMKSRPSVGAKIKFEVEDKIHLGMEHKSSLNIINALSGYQADGKINAFASLIPPNDEYQNFGIMAAIDILNGLRHAIEKYKLNADDIILIGSSYGGYVANLVTKIAPGYVRAVFDNSSWAKPNLNYVVGRDICRPEFNNIINENCTLGLFVISPWTLKSNLPNSLEDGKLKIRTFDVVDLKKMYDYGGFNTIYFFYHAQNDCVANTDDKLNMAKSMVEMNFIVSMTAFDENDIDGKIIKSMNHGMGLSMVKFFDIAMTYLNDVNIDFKQNEETFFEYSYDQSIYTFDLSLRPIKSVFLSWRH